MQLDKVTAEIRPRSDWEAVDLGFAMARRDFWRCFSVWWLAMLLPTIGAGFLLWNHPVVWVLLFWWWKPVGSRMVLFQISRRLFGEQPDWKSIFKEILPAWRRRFLYRFLWARFSPWFPVTLALDDLEGLRGKDYKIRSLQVVKRGDGVVMWLFIISEFTVVWLTFVLMALVKMLIPEGQDSAWRMAMEMWDSSNWSSIPLLVLRTVCICWMLAISLTDVFVIGGGFGLYINNRTWIEGWDVELAFKRMAQRLGKVLLLLIAFFGLALVGTSQAAEQRSPAEVIKKVKENPDFKVHTVIDRLPKNQPLPKAPPNIDFLKTLGKILVVSALVILLGGITWVLWKYRHVFRMRRLMRAETPEKSSARVVMGMEVTLNSLPKDIPTAAWELWQRGQHQEALALLYRGSISQVISLAQVDIQESDTEGDCLRRVELIANTVYSDYFRELTKAWICIAYAGRFLEDVEVHTLCQQWPFHERRSA